MTATASQLSLGIPIHQRTVLVTVETIRAALAVDTRTVLDWVEDGTLYHVWDISAATDRTDKACRELRVWMRDVILLAGELQGDGHQRKIATRQLPTGLQPDVIDAIIGTQLPGVPTKMIERNFCCSRMLVNSLWKAGFLRGTKVAGNVYYERTSLVEFLRDRICC